MLQDPYLSPLSQVNVTIAIHLQCVWVRCDKALFGFGEDVMLCAVYINPQSQAFTLAHVTDSVSSLFDELACATQVAPHFCCVATLMLK